ncbi:MAG: STAS-like domain-containing protein [Thermoplasmataceae archaeon]
MNLKVSQVIGPDLATRIGCDDLFKLIEQIPDEKVTLEFSGVLSISRSFAHEYNMKKSISIKAITEVNTPTSVRQMFEFVKKQIKKKPIENNSVNSVLIS